MIEKAVGSQDQSSFLQLLCQMDANFPELESNVCLYEGRIGEYEIIQEIVDDVTNEWFVIWLFSKEKNEFIDGVYFEKCKNGIFVKITNHMTYDYDFIEGIYNKEYQINIVNNIKKKFNKYNLIEIIYDYHDIMFGINIEFKNSTELKNNINLFSNFFKEYKNTLKYKQINLNN